MFKAITTAISSGMRFEPNDILEIAKSFKMGYWTGDGEQIYTLACHSSSGSNISAAIALETWFERPPYFWAESTRIPERLHVGSELTWEGHRVRVTSINAKRIIACSGRREYHESCEANIGQVVYEKGDYRKLEAYRKLDDGTIMMRVSGVVASPNHDNSNTRRFAITHDELVSKRKTYDAKRKAYEKEAITAVSLSELEAAKISLSEELPASFRHFDIEMLREEFDKATKRIDQTLTDKQRAEHQATQRAKHDADLQHWMDGGDVRRYFNVVRLRVKDQWVETSTQQRVTVEGVRKAIQFVAIYRQTGWHANGESFDLDQYPLKSINNEGVQVGCTFVQWSEVDRISEHLQVTTT